MTYEEFLTELNKAGLSIREFADLNGMHRNSISNYAGHSEVPSHLAVIATLLAEMNVHGIAFRQVLENINVTRKKPRGSSKIGHFGGDKQEKLNLDL